MSQCKISLPLFVVQSVSLELHRLCQPIRTSVQSRFSKVTHTHTHTTILQPFFRDHPGELVPEENFWTLWCKGRLTEADTLTGRHSIQTNQCPPPPSPHIFYGPDALPAAQPTVSKHWGQLAHLIREKTLEFSSMVLPAPSPYLQHTFSH